MCWRCPPRRSRSFIHILGSEAFCGQFDSLDWSVLTHKEFPGSHKILCCKNTSSKYKLYTSVGDDDLWYVGSLLCCRFNVAATHQVCAIPRIQQVQNNSEALSGNNASSSHHCIGGLLCTSLHTSWRFPLFWQQRLPESTWKTDVVAVCTQTLWQAVTWGGTIQHRFRSRPTIHHRHHCRLAECFFHVGVALRIRIIHHRWGHDPCSDDQGWHFGRKEGRQSEQEVCCTSPFLRKHLKIFMSVFTFTIFKHDNDILATFRSSWTPHQEL